MKWEPQPWMMVPVLIVVAVGAFCLAAWQPPRTIEIHVIGPIHVILDKAQ